MNDPIQARVRWFHFTPGRYLIGLTLVECLFWLSDRFQWPPSMHHKGWTLLIALAYVGVALLLLILWFIVSLIFRWRFQFSIRQLMLLVVAVALPCSWLAVRIKEAKTQRDVVSVIEMAGGEVFCDDREHKCQWYCHSWNDEPSSSLLPDWATFDFFHPMSHVYLVARRLPGEHAVIIRDDVVVSPELLTQVAKLSHLHYLNLAGTNAGDACLEPLPRLRELTRLDLRCTHVTEAGVAKLREMIPGAKIVWGWNDVQYRHGIKGSLYYARAEEGTTIPNERDIRSLDVWFRCLTDADVIQLKRTCPELEHLVLWQCEITDAGLEHLKGLSHLRTLSLWDFDRTDKGVKRLQQALPNCKIEHAIY